MLRIVLLLGGALPPCVSALAPRPGPDPRRTDQGLAARNLRLDAQGGLRGHDHRVPDLHLCHGRDVDWESRVPDHALRAAGHNPRYRSWNRLPSRALVSLRWRP